VLSQGEWKSLLVPGGLLVLAAGLLLHGRFLNIPTSVITFYYYAVFSLGLLLAWRFHSSRVLFALLVLLLAEKALEFFAGGKLPQAGPGMVAFDWIALLLPLNFLLLAFLQERGLTLPQVASRLLLIFFQSVLVAVLCRPARAGVPDLLSHPLLSRHLFSWTKIPLLALLAFLGACTALLIRSLRLHKPVESGFLWALIAAFLAFQFGGTGRTPSAYMATAGLALVAAVIETTYFMAYHDELTGLPARRAFNEAELALKEQYAIAIVDIDHFKQFNDTYGHETGDQVLRLVAARLARVTGGGKAFRCGGEEFAILFPEKSAKDVVGHLELLRRIIEISTFRLRGQDRRNQVRRTEEPGSDRRKPAGDRRRGSRAHQVAARSRNRELSVTVSIGVAEAGARNREVDQVIAAADKALYRAKAAGRNRVEMASGSRARDSRAAKEDMARS